MADTRDINGKEQCDILNIFKDHEGNNTQVTQQEFIKINMEELNQNIFDFEGRKSGSISLFMRHSCWHDQTRYLTSIQKEHGRHEGQQW